MVFQKKKTKDINSNEKALCRKKKSKRQMLKSYKINKQQHFLKREKERKRKSERERERGKEE